MRRDLDHVLGDGGLVLNFRDDRADGRPRRSGRASLVLRRLPKLLELLIGQVYAAAMLLENAAELVVRNIDVLLAERAVFPFGCVVGLVVIGERGAGERKGRSRENAE